MRKHLVVIIFAVFVVFIVSSSVMAGQPDKTLTTIYLAMLDHESIHLQLYDRCLQEYPEMAASFKEGISRWGEKNYPALKELRLKFREGMVAAGKSVGDADAFILKYSKKETERLQVQFTKMPAAEMEKVCSGKFVETLFSQLDFAGFLAPYHAYDAKKRKEQ